MVTYPEFEQRAQAVLARVRAACAACGRDPSSVHLLPVTKTHPLDAAVFAHRLGLPAVGENRVQEAAAKRPLAPSGLRWELIGHLQSNKAKLAVETFDRIQTVDRADLAARLGRLAGEAGKALPVLLQVNSGDDPAKFGCDLADAPALLDAALAQPALRVEGLMVIAPLSEDPDVARRAFDALRECRDRLAASRGVALPELSMGMSGDLEAAVAAGSTCIRVGSALYGERPVPA
jgi:pyridoxal phosphate enzyme (YggS family)